MTRPFGVYLHIPFCRHRCGYCAFATWTDRDHLIRQYLDALRTDIERHVHDPATSVFVGGGTPSRVPGAALGEVISAIPTVAGAEITVECNPDDVTGEMMDQFVAAGVNRISLGVQSTAGHVLAALDRTHTPANVAVAVEAARAAGIGSVNLDLIYGVAGETVEQWRSTVDDALSLRPDHVSAYALTVEAGTPLAGQPDRHPDDDDLADKYEVADQLLTGAGLANYEVSNWARTGHECRHNLLYWRRGDYLGLGAAAHSHMAGHRWWNVRTPDRYIAAVNSGSPTEAAGEHLDAETQRLEGLQLHLRLADGVPADAFEAADLDELADPAGWSGEALISLADGRARLTRRGRLMANEVSLRLR